ncbi:MAG: hypothetical protein HDR54_04850 [Treponema sp.]|nr:hypothetical protein [Treponema sp.]
MQSSFTLKKSELTMDFLEGLKKMFSGTILDITVTNNADATETPMDETEYLLSNPVNKEILLDGIRKIEKGNVKKIELAAL